jgi:hypothetical protein
MRYLVNAVDRFLQGNRLEPKEVLGGLLVFAFLFASIHLVTMLLTRWGDRRVTGKALFFSLLLHFAFFVGIVAVPHPPSVPGGGPEDPDGHEDQHRVVIHSVIDQPQRESKDGKLQGNDTPVWDRLPAPKFGKLMGPQPNDSATVVPKDVKRTDEGPEPLSLKVPDLANLPENQQSPPSPVRPEAARLERAAKTAAIEIPKSGATPKPQPRVPTLPKRELTASSSADANVKRQTVDAGSGKRAPDDGLQPQTAALPLTSAPQAPAPTPTVPQSSGVASNAEGSPRGKPQPAPATMASPETASSQKPAKGAASPLVRDPVNAKISEGRWMANVDRLRTNETGESAATPSVPVNPSATGSYQSTDSTPPVPEIQNSGAAPLLVRRSAGIAPTYRLRKLSARKANARQFGGNDQSERAVEASLHWLASVQNRNGSWDAKAFGAGQVKVDENGVDRDYAGRDADSGVTALSILAFLGAGYTHEEGQYSDTVDRALHWLVSQQRPDGNLGSGAGHFAAMYCHGIATYAVAEAYGMQNDPTSNTTLRDPLLRAVRYILDNQNPDGGWRYVKGQKSDISMFGWQLMALKSAEIAGVTIPAEAKSRMVGFLKSRSLGDHGGLAAYREDESPTPSMTAEAFFCKQMLGMRRNNAAAQEAADYLLDRLPKRSQFNEYFWYYGTVAMYQYGGAGWQSWNEAVREILVVEQHTAGEFAGSWDPISPWGRYGGRIYSTALSTLCLEVYYRFLPLYQIGNAVKD